MRQVRFGVLLDRGDLGGHAVLDALEVDDAVLALVSAAAMAGGLAAIDVAATGLRRGREERALRRRLRDVGEVRARLEATAGAGGLAGSMATATSVSNSGISAPASSVTMRPLGVGLLAHRFDLRATGLLSLIRLSVFTFTTLTPQIASTASWISGLLASEWTWNV
jgi:hypothetical protein